MAEQEKTREELEEERLMNDMNRAGHRAKSNFFGKKPALNIGGPTYSTAPVQQAPVVKAKTPTSGGMPEWKRKQMEAEADAARRREEEERYKREKVAQAMKGGVDESPTVFLAPSEQRDKREEGHLLRRLGDLPPEAEVSSTDLAMPASKPSPQKSGSSIFDADDEEVLRAEEQRLVRKTANTAIGGGAAPAVQSMSNPQLTRATSVQRCEVQWVDSRTGAVNKQQGFPTLKGRLPLATIKRLWGVRSIRWADRDLELVAATDGYSELVFANVSVVRVWCS